MAITYSTNLKLTLIGTGDQAGTWGNTTNTNLGTLIEQAIAGYVSQTVADSAGSPTSLSIADGTSSVARNMVLVLQGALSAARDIILPTSTKLYFIHNNTSGGFAVTAKCSGQTGVSIPNGAKVILACNGTDIVEAFNYSGSLIFPTSATITTLSGTTLGYGSASITNASIASGTVTNLLATTFSGGSASITTVTGTTFGTTGASQIRGASGAIGQLTVTSATITNLNVTSLTTGNFPLPTSATIATLSGTTLSYASASLTNATISSNLNLSGGTANGVAYLNGSKNLTTGSALTFNGTTLNSPQFYQSVSAPTTYSTQVLENTASNGYSQLLLNVGVNGANGQASISYAPTIFFAIGPVANDTTSPIIFRNNNATERMRIDSAGNVGVGTSSPASKLDVNGSANINGGLTIAGNLLAPSGATIYTATGDLYVRSGSSGALRFGSNGSNDRMLLDSAGNVGIGTSSPASKLHIDVDGTALRISRGSSIGFLYNTGTASTDITRLQSNSGSVQLYTTGGTATLDTAGNLGLGVTPSAWWGTISAMQVGSGGSLWSSKSTPNNTVIGSNYYVDSASATDRYLGSDSATFYQQFNGQHRWFNAPSGTAGNAVSFTQAMTLDASGNLGIGTSTPSARVDARVANIADGTDGGIVNVYSTTAQAADVGGKLALGGLYDGSNYLSFAAVSGRKENSTSGNWSGYMQFSTRRFGGGFAERMRIDSAGNVGIGTTSPTYRLTVANNTFDGVWAESSGTYSFVGLGGYFSGSAGSAQIGYERSTGAFVFGNGTRDVPTERMRIDGSGNVGIGGTPDYKLDVFSGALRVNGNAKGVAGDASIFFGSTTNNYIYAGNANNIMAFGTNGAERIRLDNAGNVGIGTSSPASKLEVKGTGFVASSISGDSTSETQLRFNTNTGARVSQQANQALIFDTNATERVRITSAGDVGIGVVSPTVKLDVAGSILASGNVTAYSDIRVKDNVESIEGAIGKLSQIRGVTYTRTDLDDKHRKYAGVIAQEIEQVLPEAVFDNGKVKAVDYNATIALLIEAVKEQQKRIDKLETLLNKGN